MGRGHWVHNTYDHFVIFDYLSGWNLAANANHEEWEIARSWLDEDILAAFGATATAAVRSEYIDIPRNFYAIGETDRLMIGTEDVEWGVCIALIPKWYEHPLSVQWDNGAKGLEDWLKANWRLYTKAYRTVVLAAVDSYMWMHGLTYGDFPEDFDKLL